MTGRREATAVLVVVVAGGALLLVAEPVLGLVAYAGVGAAAMLQPRPRTAVAAVLLLVAGVVVWSAWSRGDALSVTGGLLVAVGSAVAVARSRRWPPARRGDGGRRPRERSARDTWEALDRGEDPTA